MARKWCSIPLFYRLGERIWSHSRWVLCILHNPEFFRITSKIHNLKVNLVRKISLDNIVKINKNKTSVKNYLKRNYLENTLRPLPFNLVMNEIIKKVKTKTFNDGTQWSKNFMLMQMALLFLLIIIIRAW